MDIDELSSELTQDFEGQILTIDYHNELVLHLHGNDWDFRCIQRRVETSCHGVVDWEVQLTNCDEIGFTFGHVVLGKHNEPHGFLNDTSNAEDRYAILGRLCEAYAKLLDR